MNLDPESNLNPKSPLEILDGADYSELLKSLLTESILSEYPASTPSGEFGILRKLNLNSLLNESAQDQQIQNEEAGNCCLSGIWLLHNYLDESHEISQSVNTAEGSLWHGIMHRMEGDFGNSKYWYRSAGDHPVFERMGQAIDGSRAWDPYSFVDACRTPTPNTKHVAQLEWTLLFQHCFEMATGRISS